MNWDDYFFSIADVVAKKSHCLSRQLGAIAVRDGKFPVAFGFNGPPQGYPHCEGEVCPRHKLGYQSGQGLELCPATHAELNVLIEATRFGISLQGCTLYSVGPYPCRECSKAIVNAGIKEIVLARDISYPDIGLSGKKILETCGIKVRIIDNEIS